MGKSKKTNFALIVSEIVNAKRRRLFVREDFDAADVKSGLIYAHKWFHDLIPELDVNKDFEVRIVNADTNETIYLTEMRT